MRARLLPVLVLLLASQARPSNADMGDATASYNAPPPVFGSGGDTTVPAGVEARSVFGSIVIGSTALSAGNVTISICGGAVLENLQTAPIASLGLTWAYSFVVTGGSCYRFNNNADPTGSNRIASYNYVDVANTTFTSADYFNATAEGQAHANETAAGECSLVECVNSTWYNRTAPLEDVRVVSADHRWGFALIQYDPTPYRGLGVAVYARATSTDAFSTAGNAEEGSFFVPRPTTPSHTPACPLTAQVYLQAPSGDTTPTIDIPIPCDAQYQHNVTYVSAISDGPNVTVTWQSDATSVDSFTTPGGLSGSFEVFGGSTPDDYTNWNSVWWPWEFQPDWFCGGAIDPLEALCDTGFTRTITGPLSDLVNPNGTTYLSIHLNGNGETGEYDVTSCVVAFVADGEPHSCGTAAPVVAGGNVTYSNTTVNVTASGESFLPVVFGPSNDNAGMGDSLSVGPSPRLAATGTSLIVNGCFYPIINPFPDAAGATQGTMPCDGFAEDDVFTMTRNGTFLSADVRAIGPYQDAGDDTGIPSTENISLLVEVQKNNVTLGGATWAAGEVATKTITLTGGEFVKGDDFRIVLTPSATAPGNATYFNIVEATYGILWEGNATGGGSLVVTSTVNIKTAADPWIPLVLFGILALYCLYSRAPYYMTAFAFVGMFAGAMYRHDPSAVPPWVIDTPVVLVVLAVVWRLVTRPRTAIMEGHT